MTPDQQFVIEILKIIVSIVTILVSLLTYRKAQKVDAKSDAIAKNVDGLKEQLVDATRREAHAAGVAEGVAAVVQPSPVVPAQVIPAPTPAPTPEVNPQRRATDRVETKPPEEPQL